METDKDVKAGSQAPRSSLQPHRLVLFVSAWIFLALGVVGLFLPFVPGTLCLILAAACFTRSSPRFEAWLLDHPRLGPPVRAWRETGAIPRRGKIFAGLSLAASWLIILANGAPAYIAAVTLTLFVAVGLYVATRPDA